MTTEAKTKPTKEELEEIISVDQETKAEKPDKIEEAIIENAKREEEREESPGGFTETAEIVEFFIYDIDGRPLQIQNQPAGVFAAISQLTSSVIVAIMEKFDKTQLAALKVFQEGAESFGAEGKVAEQLESDAVKTITTKTIPAIIEILATVAPDFISHVVAMIVEPDPEKIRLKKELTYTPDKIKWTIPVDQQVKALGIYIDSLSLDSLKKKVRSFRQA